MSFEKTPLNEFITLQRGFDLPKGDRAEGTVPVVASTGVGGYHDSAKVDAPGVVIGRSVSIGGGQYIQEPFWPLNTTLWVKDFKGHDPRFIYYLMRSIDFTKFNVGSGVPTLNRNHLSSLLVNELGLDREKAISKQLGDIDDKIALNTQTNQTLEQIAQAIFKSWFVDFDPVKAKMNGEQPEGMDAATASLFPEKLVESELGLIPEGWPVDQVGNHIDVTKGKSYKSAELQESTTALVTLKSFKRGGGYRMDGLKEYTGKYKPQQVIEAGDLVMSLTDVTQAAEIVGKPALVIDAPQYDTLVASLDVAILSPKETDAKQYFYGLMSTYRFHRYAESFATGTTVLHLSPKGITTFEFACPSAELVKKYHEFAAPIFAKIEANILESQELAKLRDTLLPKLLSGEIKLGDTAIMKTEKVMESAK